MNKPVFISTFVLLLSFIHSVQAQLITVCSGDSLSLVLDEPYSGTITWRSSSDNITWTNISDSDNDTIFVVPFTSPRYYQAFVQENVECPIYYSVATQVLLGTWDASLTATNINLETVGISTFYSSSKLGISWMAPSAYTVDHYEISAVENIKNTSEFFSVPSTQTSDTITGLKSATPYTITIRACADPVCNSYLTCTENTANATTSEEYWQLQGTGDTTTTLTKIVADGSTLNYAFVYGDWAPTDLIGYTRYYYNPANTTLKGTKPSISDFIAQTSVNSSVTSFTGLPGYGLTYDGWATGGNTPKFIGQAQAIPYQGNIRMFFEGQTDDNRNRIFQLDSKDGYTGLDFNSESSTFCTNPSDFTSSGGCALQIALGIDTDPAPYTNASITDIRQFKIGYRTMDSWLWEGTDSTFMTPTFDLSSSVDCGNVYFFTTGYALYDSTNSKWNLQYEEGTACPKFFDGMQAPSVMHLGGNKYKLYFSHNDGLKGTLTNPQTATKPMEVIYAENKNGNIVFEDWESIDEARSLNYLWPNGNLLSVSQESKLDDFHFFAPTNDLDFQVQYSNMSNGVTEPIVTAAILLNP